MARRQRRDLSVFESSCHLPTCLPHTIEASHCPFNCWTSSREAVNTNFYSLWFDSTGNRTRVYRFSSRRSIHSTTDRYRYGTLWKLNWSTVRWYGTVQDEKYVVPVAYAGFWKGGGGGGQKVQKIWEELRSEFEIVTLKFRPIFRPKSGEEQK